MEPEAGYECLPWKGKDTGRAVLNPHLQAHRPKFLGGSWDPAVSWGRWSEQEPLLQWGTCAQDTSGTEQPLAVFSTWKRRGASGSGPAVSRTDTRAQCPNPLDYQTHKAVTLHEDLGFGPMQAGGLYQPGLHGHALCACLSGSLAKVRGGWPFVNRAPGGPHLCGEMLHKSTEIAASEEGGSQV